MASTLRACVARAVAPVRLRVSLHYPARSLYLLRAGARPRTMHRAKKKGKGAAAAPELAEEDEDEDKLPTLDLSPLHLKNDYGEDGPPQVKPDEEYPDWIWTLGAKEPTLRQLTQADFKSMPDKYQRRLIKLTNREKIKLANKS